MSSALEEALRRIERGYDREGPWHVLWVMHTQRCRNRLYVPPRRMLRDQLVVGYDTLVDARCAVERDVLHHRCDAWLLNVETGETEHLPRRGRRDMNRSPEPGTLHP